LTSTLPFDVLSIILIDVLLAGDNAVLIAMAVKSLPPPQRRVGIAAGAGGAVVLRVILTFFAARLLQVAFLKLIGGLLVLWIAVKLLTDVSKDHGGATAQSLRQAIWLILVADVTMSVDNIVAVAAASKGSLYLLILGLGLSITFVVFASTFLSRVMDRYPIVIWIGAAILGRVGGDMIMGDPWVDSMLHPSELLNVGVQVLCAGGVMLLGWVTKSWVLRRRSLKEKGKNLSSPGV
jgi:YjbE family integral membrane protein